MPRPDSTNGLSLRKRFLFSLVATVAAFLLIEGVLAVVGIQPVDQEDDPFVGFAANLPLFVERAGPDGELVYRTAENKSAFFNLQIFPSRKGPDTFRIFCLGGSTTYGRPYDDATSFAGWLRAFLPVADPSTNWEVVNAGGISYASYRVAALIRELTAYEPDLFIVYTGHNEFLEERTYRQIRRVPAVVRALMGTLSGTRIWSAASRLASSGASDPAPPADGRSVLPPEVQARLDHSAGPALYERDDALADEVLVHYRTSLERIVRAARGVGAEVILVTPASNLRDCTPFKSEPTEGVPAASLRRAEQLRTAAGAASPSRALDLLDSAVALDPRNADGLYARGQASLGVGDVAGAHDALRAARDEDVCPLRALTPIVDAAAEVARAEDVPLVDFVELIGKWTRERTGHPIAGQEFFLDHVHPTVEGHRLLALALVDEMADRDLVEPDATWGAEAVTAVARRVEDGIDDAVHARALANLSVTLNWAGKNEESRQLALKALESGHEDATMLMMVGRHAALDGRQDEALRYFRRAAKASPNSPVVHSQLGMLQSGRGDREAAAAHFFMAALLWDDNDTYQKQLASVLDQLGHRRAALRCLRRAAELNPSDAGLPARIARLESLVEFPRDTSARLEVTRHASGFPRTVAQTDAGPEGRSMRDGVWTEWYEDGSLKAFACYDGGRREGTVAEWAPGGERLR